jgi:Flp pilus assembly protein TadG
LMKTKRIIKDQKGGALVEFVIVLPLLVLLAFGIIEFGTLLYDQSVITNASREGARAGITQKVDTGGITNIVNTYCTNRLINFSGGSVLPTTIFPNGDNIGKSSGVDFSVKVTYDYTMLVSQLFGLGSTRTLYAKTLMYME